MFEGWNYSIPNQIHLMHSQVGNGKLFVKNPDFAEKSCLTNIFESLWFQEDAETK